MEVSSKGPAYKVLTERLLIRNWEPKDAPRLRQALEASDSHLRPFIPFMRFEPRTLSETATWLRSLRADFDGDTNYRYAIFDRAGETLLGETMLLCRVGDGAREIGYWIDARQAGKGYAMEATKALIRVGFEVDGVDRIEIHCSPDNTPSAAIPRKLGFTHEATLRRRFTDSEGDIQDTMIWTLFRENYANCPANDLPVEAYGAMDEKLL